MKYLEDKQHYINRYDLYTVEECLDSVKMFQDIYQKSLASKDLKKISQKKKLKDTNIMLHRTLFVIKGKRYEKKKETIQKWIDDDKLKQNKQDLTPAPAGITCPLCIGSMFFNSSKHLDYKYDSPILRMIFLFKCNKCKKQQWVFDNGEVRASKPDLCPKCNKELSVTNNRKAKVITTIYKCKHCNYSKKDIFDLKKSDKEHKKWQEKQDKKEREDRKLLKKYREEFCLSEKEGKKYIETLEAMEVANVVKQEAIDEIDNPTYERSLDLNKLTVTELKKSLSKSIKKHKFTNLSFDNPDIDRYVIIPFSIQDIDPTRKNYESSSDLKKLIKDTLKDTNWRLMSNGINYRLGYLKGQLKGYESEEDMLKLAGKKEKKKSKTTLDPEKRAKYASNNLVQLAKLFGEMEGIENIRKRRLAKEPEGFFLKASEGPYNCGVCGDSHYGDKIWWNLDGLKCSDCFRNIKEKNIKLTGCRYDDDNNWFGDWQIKSDYGVHPATRGKLKREGLLVGKDFKNENGATYYIIYLKDENKKFLKKYPKIDSKIKTTIIGKDGRSIEL